MKTGLYRVRRGWFGRCVLQAQFNGPAFLGGQVDASVRVLYWADVKWDQAPVALVAALTSTGAAQ